MIQLLLLTALAIFSCKADEAYDPIQDFCRRFAHRATVLNNKIYIDGGFFNRNPLSQYPKNYTNHEMLDLDTLVLENTMPKVSHHNEKPSPAVAGGALWGDEINSRFYAFGGYFPDETPIPFETWTYEATQDSWGKVTTGGETVGYLAHGMSSVAPDAGIGYWLGGYQDNRTSTEGPSSPEYGAQMIQFDMVAREYSKYNGPDENGRGEGVMLFIPAGFAGILVYFGGVIQDKTSGELKGAPLNEIWMFDIDLQKWYLQQASGDVPLDRKLFCGGVSWADDKSSYNIYIYGGASTSSGPGYDDLYILTIPSFVWVKMYPTDSQAQAYPHHSTTCNIINGTQMIVMGGTFPANDICDAPSFMGQHNVDLGQLNENRALWSVFTLSNPPYRIPPSVVSIIGGTEIGGANVTSPKNMTYDKYLFQKSYKVPQRYPTPVGQSSGLSSSTSTTVPTSNSNSNSSSQPSRSVLIGSIVGAVVGGICIGTAGFCILSYLRRRRGKLVGHGGGQTSMKDEDGKSIGAEKMEDEPAGELQTTERPGELWYNHPEELWVDPAELPDARSQSRRSSSNLHH